MEKWTCPRCNKTLPLTTEFFSKNASRKSGFHTYCKICQGKQNKNYYRDVAKRKSWNKSLEKQSNSRGSKKKIRTMDHTEKTIQYIKENSHLTNRRIAVEIDVPYQYVLTWRKRLEASGDIDFHDKLLNENGEWRTRRLKLNSMQPYIDIDVVYFIAIDWSFEWPSPIKIGTSDNVHRRLGQLQNASPYPMIILKVTDGSSSLESHVHRMFDAQRMLGEWFAPSQEMHDYIEGLSEASINVLYLKKEEFKEHTVQQNLVRRRKYYHDHYKEKAKEYYQQNREKIINQVMEYQKSNKKP